MEVILICKKTKDDNFIINKEYTMNNGYLYTEYDISINTSSYNSVENAIQDLANKGYEFVLKNNTNKQQSDAFGFSPESIFGDIFSMYNSNSTQNYQTNIKKEDAENLKNDILKNILNFKF